MPTEHTHTGMLARPRTSDYAPQTGDSGGESSKRQRSAPSNSRAIDPVTILILTAANGYAADLVPCGVFCRDPDLWSYLVKAPRGKFGKTPLHCSAFWGDVERARVLLELGAPLEAWSKDLVCGSTPLLACIEGAAYFNTRNEDYLALVRMLLDNGCQTKGGPDSPLQLATFRYQMGIARLLLDRGADVNEDNGGPLCSACRRLHPEAVSFLLANGADVNAVSTAANGLNTALHVTADVDLAVDNIYNNHGRAKVLVGRLLLDHGADVNARNFEGVTALGILTRKIPFVRGLDCNSADCALANLLEQRGGTL